jgi:hypothetical protein
MLKRGFKDATLELFSIAVGVTVVGLCACGAAVIGWQVLEWLRLGAWPVVTVQSLFNHFDLARPESSWVGVQKIIDYVLASSLAAAFPVTGLLIFLVVIFLGLAFAK